MDEDGPTIGRREAARVATLHAIEGEARRQLADVGAAALSLRAVARELGMVSSGIYRYVASRDELLTRLIVSGYGELADAIEAATERGAPARLAWAAAWRSARSWALERPHEWALLYGSPVPGYAAPAETIEPAARVFAALAGTIGATTPRAAGQVDPVLAPDLDRLVAGFELPGGRAQASPLLGAVGHLVGTVSLEVFGHLTGVIEERARDAHFDVQIELSAGMVGL